MRSELEKLEALLHYFYVTCGPAVAGMDFDKLTLLLTNVACVASEAFISRKRTDRTTDVILNSTVKYYEEIIENLGTGRTPPEADELWISFDEVAAKAKEAKAKSKSAPKAGAPLLPKVIQYDESGRPVDFQETRLEKEAEHDRLRDLVTVPWKEWCGSIVALNLDQQRADIAAITMVLRSIHYNGNVGGQAVVATLDLDSNKSLTVKAGRDVEMEELELPPCVPAVGRIHTTSTHPHRAAITVTHRDDQRTGCWTVAKYYVHPEYKVPSDVTPETAVAEGVEPGTRIWQWRGDESLHPYWAVQRITTDDLKKKNARQTHAQTFNVALKEKQYNVVTVGEVGGNSVSMTMIVSLPMITNERALVAGEELLMEVAPKAPQKRKVTSWKDDVASVAKAKTKAARPALAKAKIAAHGLEIPNEV